jgi:hypothetical protein
MVLALIVACGVTYAADPVPETPSPDATAPNLEKAASEKPALDEACGREEKTPATDSLQTDEALAAETSGGPVGICVNTFCPSVGTRCSNPVWQKREKCCDYTCVSDPSCTQVSKPANVCFLEE